MKNDLPKSKGFNPLSDNIEDLPKVFYKYRSFDPDGYAIQLAINGDAYFASAKDFNDPFDNYFIPKTKLANLEGVELVWNTSEIVKY